MIPRLVLTAALAFVGVGLPTPTHPAQSAPAQPSQLAPALPAEVLGGPPTGGSRPAATDDAPAPGGGELTTPVDRDEVVVTDLEVVVPPVEAAGEVVAPRARFAPDGDDVVVTDQVVAPDRVASDVVEAGQFQMLGVTWPGDVDAGELEIEVRTRTDGEWSGWVPLETADDAPDPGTADAVHAGRGGTDSLWVGEADAVQVSFAASEKGGPDGLSLALVDVPEVPAGTVATGVVGSGDAVVRSALGTAAPGTPSFGTASFGTASFGTASFGTASGGAVPAALDVAAVGTALPAASPGAPHVIPRSQWGARPQVCTPDVASKLVGAVVHHTAGRNTYATVEEAMRQIRGDQAYHIDGRGWCDLGYNFVVDKWGNIYEGRARSLTEPVIGVHAGGFNTGTVGVSMLGTYDAAPSAATQRSVAQIIGWRLGAYGINPQGSMTYYTGNGENSKFHNQNVALPRVFGHRDVAYTACPGNGGYAALGNIRAMAADFSYDARFRQANAVVKAMYEDILGRGVDPSGLVTWSGMLAAGSGGPALVDSLTRSDEYIRLRIRHAYEQVLGRAPEPAGMDNWHRQIRAGVATVDDVARRFMSSVEFMNKSGGTVEGYVTRMYTSVLGRAPSASDIDHWSGEIRRLGRERVTDQIWFSREAAGIRASAYYEVFLKRKADAPGRETWTTVLLTRGEGAVRIGIAGSDEYRERALLRYP